ncbi:MAG: glycosyltransferase [Planctomycetes bacterium]|nr:glycosyltransferase [Planctomycetota bacterium]
MPLTVLLIPLGSAGDVHPLVGLADRLRLRGHHPVVITNPHFEPLIRQLGLEFVPLGTAEEYDRATHHPDLWHPSRGFRLVARFAMLDTMRPIYEIIRQRNVAGRTVVVAPATALGARMAQDKLGVPLVTVDLQPALLRSQFNAPTLPPLLLGPSVPGWLKRFQYYLTDKLLIDPILAGEVNAFRTELGLPRVDRLLDGWWHSPHRVLGMFPDWFAPPQPDWPAHITLASFPLWDETEAREVPPELEQFLSDGTPPIVFTPGSAMRQGKEFFAAAIDATQKLGRRALLLTRYPEQLPTTLPAGIGHFDYIPFSQVLPRAAAVVHHGGIGTVGQGLAAGVPQLIMPMSHDQPDNAARITRLGVGRTVWPKQFRGPVVAAALSELLDSPDTLVRCRELAERLHNVDGLELAADVIQRSV